MNIKKFKFHVKTHFIVFPMKYQHNTLILSSNFTRINMKSSVADMRGHAWKNAYIGFELISVH
jgi:hypothetical protein